MCGCNKAKPAAANAKPATTPRPAPFSRMLTQQRQVQMDVAPTLVTLDTSVWGPQLWKALHVAAYNPSSEKNMRWWGTLLNEMQYGLPCPDCRAHYSAWYRSHPLTTRSASIIPIRRYVPVSVGQWINDLHNDVNRRTGKPTWSFGDSARANGSDQLEAAKAAAVELQGKISDNVWNPLNSLLNAC